MRMFLEVSAEHQSSGNLAGGIRAAPTTRSSSRRKLNVAAAFRWTEKETCKPQRWYSHELYTIRVCAPPKGGVFGFRLIGCRFLDTFI